MDQAVIPFARKRNNGIFKKYIEIIFNYGTGDKKTSKHLFFMPQKTGKFSSVTGFNKNL